MKTAPSKRFGSRSCEGLGVFWTRIVKFFGSGAHPKSVKTYFLEITWFRPEKPFQFLISAGKILWISVKTFFLLEITCIRPKKTLEFLISAGNKPLNFWFRLEKPFEFRWRPFFFFLLFGDHQYSAGKKPLNFWFRPTKTFEFRWRIFFFGDHLILTEKPPESNLRLIKIWVKFVFGCIKFPKKPPPPPLRNPGYATAIDNKVICSQRIHSCLIRISKFWIVTGCF